MAEVCRAKGGCLTLERLAGAEQGGVAFSVYMHVLCSSFCC